MWSTKIGSKILNLDYLRTFRVVDQMSQSKKKLTKTEKITYSSVFFE